MKYQNIQTIDHCTVSDIKDEVKNMWNALSFVGMNKDSISYGLMKLLYKAI